MSFLKILILSVLIVVIVFGLSKQTDPTTPAAETDPEILPVKEISVNGNTFGYYYWISKIQKTKLIANFDDKQSTKYISLGNDCFFGINGSFYSENREPLAGWETEGNVRKEITKNVLLNGYVGVSNSNKLWLGKSLPTENMRWGMQAGPVLISGGEADSLEMAADKPARRSVAAKNSNGDLIALSIYTKNSRFDGPLLDELPQTVKNISDSESLQITDAINLDGGAASGYYSPSEQLPEMVAVGSWICASK